LCVSPIDVVLDRDKALVVQPDIIFIAADRLHIIKDRIWGAPDLVVEVLSPTTAKRDRTTKLGWYRRYGVKECWLIDPKEQRVEVVDLVAPAVRRKTFSASMRVRSRVFPDFRAKAVEFFR
jgi:Uma2 family endonuclease